MHRNIKPAHILVPFKSEDQDSDDDPEFHFDRAKLADLGWAWPKNERGPSDFRGTLGYISPEQIRTPHNVNKTDDIFSMGVVLYEMLSGDPVFGGSAKDKNDATLSFDFEPIQSIVPYLNYCTCAVIQRCMAKKAEDRYADATALLRAIRSCLDYLEARIEEKSGVN